MRRAWGLLALFLALAGRAFAAPSVTAGLAPVEPGQALSFSWAGIPTPKPMDWVGLFRHEDADQGYRAWRFLNGQAVGSLTLPLPATLPTGIYELRLYPNDLYTRLATSAPFPVGADGPLPVGPTGPVGPDIPLTAAEQTAFASRVTVAGLTGAAITAACKTASSQGKRAVYLPAGAYRVDSTVTVPAGLTLYGEGSRTVVKVGGSSVALFLAGGDGIRLTRLTLVGQSPEWLPESGNTTRGVMVWGKKAARIDHCDLSGFNLGVQVILEGEATVDHCRVHHCRVIGQGYGVTVQSGGVLVVQDNEFWECRHMLASNGAIDRKGTRPTRFSFSRNWVKATQPGQWMDSGIDTHSGFDGSFLIEGNRFDAHPEEAIGILAGEGGIRDNLFTGPMPYAVRLRSVWENGVLGRPHDVQIRRNRYVSVTARYDITPRAVNITIEDAPPGARRR